MTDADEDRRVIRAGYDDIAATYDETRDLDAPEAGMTVEMVGNLPADARVLDAGCGAGRPITAALATEARVIGLDFSGGQLALASENVPTASLVQGDMTALPFADDTFDALVSAYAVIHVPWDAHGDCFAEFHRVCREGAPVLLTVGTTDWVGENDDWLDAGAEMRWSIPGPERARTLLTEAGFTVGDRTRLGDGLDGEHGEWYFLRARA